MVWNGRILRLYCLWCWLEMLKDLHVVKGSGPAQMSQLLLPFILRLVPEDTSSLQQSLKRRTKISLTIAIKMQNPCSN